MTACLSRAGAAEPEDPPPPPGAEESPQPAPSEGQGSLSPGEVSQMSLEELLAVRVTVTSVAGVGQDLIATPAAIAVLTGAEVRRSGFRTIADSLRMAPGVFVGRTGSQSFSVGMRGFNGSLANKTLVLIDGRRVYDPLFGGTFWDVQDTLLEDLDRVEVIRGPGATLWGANAVNGVINITTKSAQDTQGLYLSGGGGTFERAFAEARYGFKIDDTTWMRVYGTWFMRAPTLDFAGDGRHDDWDMARGGFRLDRGSDDTLRLTVQGDFYDSERVSEYNPMAAVPGQNIQFVSDIRDQRRLGVNLLARVGQESGDQGWSLQGYYDRTERGTNVTFEVKRDTFDLDWRHHFKAGDINEVVWGLKASYTRDQTRDGVNLLLDPRNGDFTMLSGFVQDTITIVPDQLFAMVGSKFLWNNYTGFEVQPGARLWWTPTDRQTLWAAVSRPVRVPSRTEEQGMLAFTYLDEGLLNGGPPNGNIIPIGIRANDDLKSEKLLAGEVGYRIRATDQLTFDASLFYNSYDDLIYVRNILDSFNNDSSAETYGLEVAASWRPTPEWRLEASYSFVNVLIHGVAVPSDEGNTPRNQAQVRTYLTPVENVDLFGALYYVDSVATAKASSYLRLDVGVTWRITPNFEVSVWGQNLLEDQHREFSSTNEVPRGVYAQGTLRF